MNRLIVGILAVFCFSTYSIKPSIQLSNPLIEHASVLATNTGKNLTMLAKTSSPAVVNYGIYSFINSLNKPGFIIFGTEAAILLTLSCSQDPMACLSSVVNLENLQAVTQLALENVAMGTSYAVGEEIAHRALALTQGKSSKEIAQNIMTALSAAGIGFYAWSMDPSLSQSMLLSLCSAVVLSSLTSARQHPALSSLQEKINQSIGATHIGKILGVATVAAGSAALAYPQAASQALLGAITYATDKIFSPQSLVSVQNMIRSNYSWIEGYRWTKNIFTKWSY